MGLYHQWRQDADPDRPAITTADLTLTYADLDARVVRAVAWLRDHDVRPADVVALMLPRTTALVELVLACFALGAIAWPLNDRYTAAEVDGLLDDADPRLAILPDALIGSRGGIAASEIEAQLARQSPGPWPEAPGPDQPAMLMYTSGTTGRPKGALHSHGTLQAAIEALHTAWRWSADDVLLHALPMFHIHGLVVAQFGALRAGAHTRWAPRFDAEDIAHMLSSGTVSVFMGVPTFYQRLVALPGDPDFGGVRLFTSGSAPLSAETHARFAEGSGHAVLERYGMTEVGIVVANPFDDRRRGSIGHPLPGVEVRIVDPDTGRDRPDGEVGELWIRGPSVFVGYRGRPDATSAVRVDGWMHTGDLGHRDPEGYLYLAGRRSDLVISGGFNVYPAEVEAVLRDHPGVVEAAVYGVADPDLGERPAAAIVGTADPTALGPWLRERLAGYKVPRRIVALDALPRNAMGKVLKARLRGMLPTPIPDEDR